ncbi:hypothetical protein [uncultured Algibacter sp.]|uniref:hypothetical protein n=1 Tax=uncultured Algibacter sp. TaxID=298659 RepID=UPI003216A517
MALTNVNLINEIDAQIKNKILNIEDVIDLSNQITSEKLKFTFNKAPSNPNNTLIKNRAHCVGYAALFNAIRNHILKHQNMTEHYEFTHLVGKLHVLGYDIHNVFDRPFFKDHDFNAKRNKISGKTIFTDPSVRDYLRIKRVRLK